MEGDFKHNSDPVFQGTSNAKFSLETSCQAQPQQPKDDAREMLSRDIIDLKLEDALRKSDENADEMNRRSKGLSEDLEAVLDGALLPETFRATKDATGMSNTASMRKKVSFEDFSETQSPNRGHREDNNDSMSTILKEESVPDVFVLHQFAAQTLHEYHYQTSPVLNNAKMGKKRVTTNFNDHPDELMYENDSEMECKKEEVPGESRVINKCTEEGELEEYDNFEELDIKEPGRRKLFVTPMSGFCHGGNCTRRVSSLSLHPQVHDEGYYQMIEKPEFKPTSIRPRIEMLGQCPEHGRTGYYQTIWPTNSPPCDAYLLDKSLELPPTRFTDPFSSPIDTYPVELNGLRSALKIPKLQIPVLTKIRTDSEDKPLSHRESYEYIKPAVEEESDIKSRELRKKQNSTQTDYRIPDTKRPELIMNIVDHRTGSDNNIKFRRFKMGGDGIQVQKKNEIQDSLDSILSAAVEGHLPFVYHESMELRQKPKWSLLANEFFGDPHAAARLFIGPIISKPRLSNYTNLYQSDSVYHLTHESHADSQDVSELDDIFSQYHEDELLLTMKLANLAESDLYPFPFHGLNNETDTMNLGLLEEGFEHSSSMSTDNSTVANISPPAPTDSRSKKQRNKRSKRSTSRSHKRENIKIKCETAFVFNTYSGSNAFSLEELEHLMKLAKEHGNEGAQSRGRKT